MRPGEILDAQRDLLERLTGDPLFKAHQALAATWALGLTEKARLERAQLRAPEWGGGATTHTSVGGKAWVEAMAHNVRAAYAYRVTPDMCTVLEHAASALDESDTFDRDLAPTPCGIVRFERPIKVVDARGKQMLVHWAVWGPANVRGGPGLALNFFNDAWTEADSSYSDYDEWMRTTGSHQDEKEARATYEQAMRVIGRWMSAHQTGIRTGESLGPSLVEAHASQQALIVSQNAQPHSATNLFRYIHALFLLLNQTITRVEDEFPDRHARKRATKAGLPPKVTVIGLRRMEGSRQEGESLVEWSHRWIVRGHWAWRRCGADKPQAQSYEKGWRVRVWIAPYVKGPDDAPLIVSEKLYSLER